MVDFLLGVDGGGTGTRVLVANRAGVVLAHASAGPSALGQGVASAWREILKALGLAFAQLQAAPPDWSRCAIGAGLSGVNHQPWRDAFTRLNPGFSALVLESDAYTALLAAHNGQPGVLVAAGTGSVGEALYADGTRCQVSGWGFPVGDEGSGAWLGLRAMAHTQQCLDGRAQPGALARRIQAQCGASRSAVQQWCASAGQFEYAQLARAVFDSADEDRVASALLDRAAQALDNIANTLDPQAQLPLALFGSVGHHLSGRLAPLTRDRCVVTHREAAHGALTLIQHTLEKHP